MRRERGRRAAALDAAGVRARAGRCGRHRRVERPLPAVERIVNNEAVQRGADPGRRSRCSGSSTRAGSTTRCCSRPSPRPCERSGATRSTGVLLNRIATSLECWPIGYAAGRRARGGVHHARGLDAGSARDMLSTLTAMFNPLPAIALLPLALIWFGLGMPSLVFVHRSIRCCGRSRSTPIPASARVPETLRMSGRNFGLSGRALRRPDPDPGGVPLDPGRPEDRLGLRLAHADRGRAGVRRLGALGRARLVHLRGARRAR